MGKKTTTNTEAEGTPTSEPSDLMSEAEAKLTELEKLHSSLIGEKTKEIEELEQRLAEATSDARAMTERHNALVLEKNSLEQRLSAANAALSGMVPGKQLVDEGTHEVVVVRRKKIARPTGRIIPKAVIRVTIDTVEGRQCLRSEGARLAPEGTEGVHMVSLQPVPTGRDPIAYTVPEAVAREVVARGLAEEELR